ncbi:MAG: hypothetical protein ACRYFK_16640 [Janthinobacterium lividum]
MAELPPWPGFFTPPDALGAWLAFLSRQHRGDPVAQRHLLTLRWLLLAELDRSAPAKEPLRADYS